MGINIPTKDELIANKMPDAELAAHLGRCLSEVGETAEQVERSFFVGKLTAQNSRRAGQLNHRDIVRIQT